MMEKNYKPNPRNQQNPRVNKKFGHIRIRIRIRDTRNPQIIRNPESADFFGGLPFLKKIQVKNLGYQIKINIFFCGAKHTF